MFMMDFTGKKTPIDRVCCTLFEYTKSYVNKHTERKCHDNSCLHDLCVQYTDNFCALLYKIARTLIIIIFK